MFANYYGNSIDVISSLAHNEDIRISCLTCFVAKIYLIQWNQSSEQRDCFFSKLKKKYITDKFLINFANKIF